MRLVRPFGGTTAATVAGLGSVQHRNRLRRWAAAAMVAALATASSASAIVLTGGPTYTPPNGGSCTASGDPGLSGGTTYNCSAPITSYTNIYIGIKNNNSATKIGLAMRQNNEPAGAEIFSWSSEAGAQIIAGTARSMGYVVEGHPTGRDDAFKLATPAEFDAMKKAHKRVATTGKK